MNITRRQANAEGKTKYFTGKPCKNMHVAERYVVNGHCTICSYARSTEKSIKEQVAAHRLKNKSKHSSYHLKWIEQNREKKNAYMREYNRQKNASGIRMEQYHSSPLANLEARSRARVNKAFQRSGYAKATSTQKLIGCTWEFLKEHIERQFKKGMNWSNRSKWHIDHIVPVASAATEEELVSLFHFTNLRPLWAKENQSKSSKMEVLL